MAPDLHFLFVMQASIAKEEAGFASVKLGKKPKDLFANGKRAEKRKISWQDQLALKV